MDLPRRKGVVEDRQLVKISVPHIEISFFRRGSEQIQLRTNCEGADSWISMELLIGLRVDFDAISIKTQPRAIGAAEIYDPAAGTFSATGSLNTARGAHTATVLPDGTVLMVGGYSLIVPTSSPILTSAEVYNPATSTFIFTGSLPSERWQHTATLLNDGTVLVAAGFGSGNFLASALRYFSTAPLAAMQVTTPTTLATGQPSTAVLTNPTAFNGSATGVNALGFNGILPSAPAFQGFNPLVVSGVRFSTLTPTVVNVTSSAFYSPNNYPADFVVDSSNPGSNNQVTITLPDGSTRDVSAGTDGGGEGLERAVEPVPHERCAEAERRVEASRFDRKRGGVALDDLDALGEPGGADAVAREGRELGGALDADDAAAELRRELGRGACLAAGHVEHGAVDAEAQPLAEQVDLLPAHRVLQLVVALGDRVVPGHERKTTRG